MTRLDPALRDRLGAAAVGVDKFLRGFDRVLVREKTATNVLIRRRDEDERLGLSLTPDLGTPWSESRNRFLDSVQRAAGYIERHPKMFTPLAFGVLHNLGEPSANGGPLREFVDEHWLSGEVPCPSLDRRSKWFPAEPTAGQFRGSFNFDGPAVRFSNVVVARVFDARARGTVKRRRGAPRVALWEGVYFLILERLVKGARSGRASRGGTPWMLLAQVAFAFGWKAPDAEHGLDDDESRRQNRRRHVKAKVAKIRTPKFRRQAQTAADWYETHYSNGWGPYIDS